MIDFDISISSPLLERDGDARDWPVGAPDPTLDIVLANFSGGRGNGYSVRPNIKFTAHAAVLRDKKPVRPHPTRVVVQQLSEDFVRAGEQFAVRATLYYPHPPKGSDGVAVRFGWGASSHIVIEDGRGISRILWLPEGADHQFSKGDPVPASSYSINFVVPSEGADGTLFA